MVHPRKWPRITLCVATWPLHAVCPPSTSGARRTAVFRVAPGSGVPRHLHSRVYDLFVGVKGLLEIRYEGQHGHGIFRP